MTGILREKPSRHDDARSLLRAIYAAEAVLHIAVTQYTLTT